MLAETHAHGEYWIVERIPPFNRLARRSNDGHGGLKRQVLVSNVDSALLLMGLDHDFNLRRLERYVALVRMAEVQPVLVLSKADTCSMAMSDHSGSRRLVPSCRRGTAAFALDTRAIQAREKAWRRGCCRARPWCCWVRAGRGKSTLTNTLACLSAGQGAQDTGGVRGGDSRGRHTTTARTLFRTGSGACIIDTPGLRALRLDAGDEADLAAGLRRHPARGPWPAVSAIAATRANPVAR